MSYRKLTHTEWLDEAQALFGPDAKDWTFRCPQCGLESSGHDFIATAERLGVKSTASTRLGQECLGRLDPTVGCDWAAYGLFRGPWEVTDVPDDGRSIWCFPFAEAAA